MATSSSSSSMFFGVISSPHHCHIRNHSRINLFVGTQKPSLLLGGGLPLSRSSLVLARRRNNASATTSSKKKDPKKREKELEAWEADLKRREKKLLQHDDEEGDDLDEDAIEALFSQLEEDLKNDNLSTDDSDGEITEEDLARLEQELEDVLGDEDDDELSASLYSNTDNVESDDTDDEEEERPLKLRNWQLRRLASSLKIGRRKTSIKSLSAELGLDRAVVLELLRDPPPNILLMCAALPDKVIPTPLETENKVVDSSPATMGDVVESEPEERLPVRVMQSRWSTQKRLKKVHAETLERVYSRTKRPTNTMICSVVHVTNLPRKTVVKWFEDRRIQDGVPDNRSPFRRSMPETVSTN